MNLFRLVVCSLGVCLMTGSSVNADSRWSIGFSFGVPFHGRHWHCHGPHHWGYFHYRPATLYVERPVVIQTTPVYLEERRILSQPAPLSQQYNPPPQPAPSVPTTQPTGTYQLTSGQRIVDQAQVSEQLRLLNDPSEQVRSNAVIALGRMKAERAVDALAATLAGDRSPLVRDSAARALGLIGSPRALTALSYAARSDNDRDVRRSAQFAVEIIQANQNR